MLISTIIRFYIVLFVILISFASIAKETVILAYYNDAPPWQTKHGELKGLSNELATFLNSDKNSPYNFVPEFITRNRINIILAKDEDAIVVAWVHPSFFDDAKKNKYLWSQPLISDSQLIISSKKHPIQFNNISSLKGKVFSAVAGTRYKTLEPLINAGEIKRIDTVRFVAAIQNVLLANKGIDFCIIEKSTFNFFKKIDKSTLYLDMAYISEKPFTPFYKRSLLIPLKNKEIFNYLNQRLKDIKNNKEWKKILNKYGQ
jgi:polar amino acid transport system substrate-binding protein